MKTAIAALLMLSIALPATAAPAGFKPALSHKSECEAMVPTSWGPGVAGIGFKAASGASTVLISMKPGSLAQEKPMMASMFKIVKTYEDSASRYWVEYTDGPAGKVRHWYVLAPVAGGMCSAILDFDAGLSETDAKTIATTLKKH